MAARTKPRQGAIVLATLLLGAACEAPAQRDRYLYVLSCDARVRKVDTILERQVSSRALDSGAPGEQLIPHLDANETLDGCLVNSVVFDAKASVFYTVVPEQVRLKPDGTKDYRMIGFGVPGLAPVEVVPAGTGVEEAPHIEAGIGRPKVVPAAGWSPQTDLDVSTYAPKRQEIRNQILEESGSKVLLRVFTGTDQLALAVADRNAKSVVELKNLVLTTARNIHLTPGGEAVLAEETDGAGMKTGDVVLYDSKTGLNTKKLVDSKIKTMSFLAISPNGKGIYHLGDEYGFLNLGRKFSGGSVVRLLDTDSCPPVFFASR